MTFLSPIGALSLALLAAGASVLPGNGSAAPRLRPGAAAPETTFSTLDGKDRTLHVLRGEKKDRVLALVFVASECKWSNAVLEELASLAKDFREKNMCIVVIDTDAGAPAKTIIDLERQARDGGLAMEVLRDSNARAADAFGAVTTPDVFLVGSDGKIQYTGRVNDLADPAKPREAKRQYLREALTAIAAGKAPSPDRTACGGSGLRRG